ncbi:GDSL-type esterase/lipase family protein [Aureliella helgolandensis]|uniref:Multifunctional acyl-CoA thioesterase I and protease I and lysophospholipase L1 n=1 Tax=Aureliella helgolandensis TaxID=2527968 RepID=A0A518G7S9_9BACT|nr:GDSL-type esterase/lipase family protein [Aureliella helgolandensis]QDV24640.1 multifunctional acyl-CoA thioesterase I and protease I and lysophospholipase L1 [Aureliella helgolandensis]
MNRSINRFQLATRVALAIALVFHFAFATGDLGAQQPDAERPTIVTLGDSITKAVRPGVTESQTFASLLGKEHGQKVVNVGIGGERTDQALKRLEKEVIALRPRFVLIMYGTNDSYIDQGKTDSRLSIAAYQQNLTDLTGKLLLEGIEPILMTPPPLASSFPVNGIGEHPNVSLQKFVEACRQVAVENALPLIDHFKHWSEAEASGTDLRSWTTDGCHPNPAGQAEVAKLALKTLRALWTPNTELVPLQIQLETVLKREDPEDPALWFHPRLATGNDNQIVMTVQKHLGRSDHFSGLSTMQTHDEGKHWDGPTAHAGLDWVTEPGGVNIAVADVTPGFHRPTNRFLANGAQVRYSEDGRQLDDQKRSHQTAYAVRQASGEWTSWKRLEMPEDEQFDFARSACAQWIVEDDGSLLLPFYIRSGNAGPFATTIVRCDFDGETIRYREHGEVLRLDVKRGLYEPSIVKYQGRYFLTMRNDLHAYVTVSEDGLNYRQIKAWTFDDGSDLGSYNTQAHWLDAGKGLFLVYTRRGANNDHVMRHRAPLFIAQVDPDHLHLIRSTEKVVVPERGATLGNFGVARINALESWVTVGEGNVNEQAKQRGADGSLFLARVKTLPTEPVVFTAMGCGPYSPAAEQALKKYIELENEDSSSRFLVHCGDIVTGKVKDWPEAQYESVAELLTTGNHLPTFIVPGDNEWNDQVDPDRHWGYWTNHFLKFDERWPLPAGTAEVQRQTVRPENFAFLMHHVLFVGINKVGGKVHDREEWEKRLEQNGEWVSQQLATYRNEVHSAVIFAQASASSPIGAFQESLVRAAREFEKPILYLHADGHQWINEPGKYAANITRVQLDVVNESFPPVQVQVTGDPHQPFVFDRRLDKPTWQLSEK